MKYEKKNPRLTVKIIDGNSEEELFEIKNKTWMNVGELFTDGVITSIIKTELGSNSRLPEKILVIVASEFELKE